MCGNFRKIFLAVMSLIIYVNYDMVVAIVDTSFCGLEIMLCVFLPHYILFKLL